LTTKNGNYIMSIFRPSSCLICGEYWRASLGQWTETVYHKKRG
jgi:hypothetical protein